VLRHVERDPAGDAGYARDLRRCGAARARSRRDPDRAARDPLGRVAMRLALALLLATATAASAAPEKITYNGKAMGTVVSVYFWTDKQPEAAKAANEVFAEMKRLDEEMTTWLPTSDVSKINAAAGVKPVAVSDETIAVIERALDISKRSNGLFD